MSERNTKIVMITMFKNEAKVIRRMLESCFKYIDFYVIQDNGSTDGTDTIVREFFKEKQIPGVLYKVEEGWKGFGWNRDHLIQTCQSIDHGCDWILKMDCDEELVVDDDFDWSPFDNQDTIAFHIAAEAGTAMYYRAWIWNNNLIWRFNHDPCHETIYYIDQQGTEIRDFPKVNLSSKIRHRGFNEGESWSVATKYITDSLVLEEKLIREGTMLSDLYHFWYVGKSYFDSYKSPGFPLKLVHQQEYARRSIFYFKQYIEYVHGKNPVEVRHDEMGYFGLIFAAEAHRFLGELTEAEETYNFADRFSPRHNDHLYGLALLYQQQEKYDDMAAVTTLMMDPYRTNPFPEFCTFVDTSIYFDSPTGKIQELHKMALENLNKPQIFNINPSQKSRLFVVDNFYSNPDSVREYALSVEYNMDNRWYKGLRSSVVHRPPGIKEAFEKIIGEKITVFDEHSYNGVFQLMTAADPQVYHYDLQRWAAIVYLTPNAPTESGTRLHKSRVNGTRHRFDENADDAFAGNFIDATRFDTIDVVANIYNRVVIMDAQCFHSAGPYFGDSMETGRLTHLFFFD